MRPRARAAAGALALLLLAGAGWGAAGEGSAAAETGAMGAAATREAAPAGSWGTLSAGGLVFAPPPLRSPRKQETATAERRAPDAGAGARLAAAARAGKTGAADDPLPVAAAADPAEADGPLQIIPLAPPAGADPDRDAGPVDPPPATGAADDAARPAARERRPDPTAGLCPSGPYPALYSDPAPFEAALAATAALEPWEAPVPGVTVPHHLPAADLIASGLRLAAGAQPMRLIVLMPDHFRRAPAPFAVAIHGFGSPLGPVPLDAAAAATLLAAPGDAGPLVAPSCLFGQEHGLQVLLPFFARLFPGVPVLAVAVALNSTPGEWQALADALAPLAEGALVVQSTDFSHYLPQWQARGRDQEVLNLLAAGDLTGLARLRQPEHVDSVGANWVQVALQAARGAAPLVLANRNQQETSPQPLAETTSYMVILYTPPGRVAPRTPIPGSRLLMLGGDFFLGRGWLRPLTDELATRRVAVAALAATGGLPLVLNLEGALLPEVPASLPPLTLAMPDGLARAWLARLNVVAVGLANNHSADLGAGGEAATRAALAAAGLPFAGQGERLALPGVTLVALSDYRGGASPRGQLLDARLLDRLILPDPAVPVLAFVHWGDEGAPEPNPRQHELAAQMAARGVAAIVGTHPHRASAAPIALEGGATLLIPSLGNFMFDQRAPAASGAVVEVRSFAQGTLFLRQLPLPPLYDLALDGR